MKKLYVYYKLKTIDVFESYFKNLAMSVHDYTYLFSGQFGVPRPWYFFVTKSYWMGSSYVSDSEMGRRNYEMNPNQQSRCLL